MKVGCILYKDDEEKKVLFLGYGELVGMEIPDEDARGLAEACRLLERPNPKIVLNDGKVVWGCECWWGNVEEMNQELHELEEAGYKIETVDIDEIRKEQEE